MLKLLYAWLVEVEEIPADPMARLRPPIVPDKPVPIVPADGLKRLFAVCAGSSFEARRDTALLMLLLDTGARRAEMTGLTLDGLDLDLDVLVVLGKGYEKGRHGLVRRWCHSSITCLAQPKAK